MDTFCKVVCTSVDDSLDRLEFSPGDLLGFDNHETMYSMPFLLAIGERLERGFHNNPDAYHLLYPSPYGTDERWSLYTKGDIIGLRGSKQKQYPDGERSPPRPFYERIRSNFSEPYCVTNAFAGEDAICKALLGSPWLWAFASDIRMGRIAYRGSSTRKFLEKAGLDFLLPSQLRFRMFV